MRECLKMLLGSNPAAGKKEEIVEKVISSDDVEFYWLISTADFEIGEKEVHSALLKEIVQLYVTIRGFSYASFWMEKFKQSAKKSTQRSKSLRRDLYDSSLYYIINICNAMHNTTLFCDYNNTVNDTSKILIN